MSIIDEVLQGCFGGEDSKSFHHNKNKQEEIIMVQDPVSKKWGMPGDAQFEKERERNASCGYENEQGCSSGMN